MIYPITENSVDNFWLQPIDGSPGRQITNFTSDRISWFCWSPDGKQLLVRREHLDSDVILLREGEP